MQGIVFRDVLYQIWQPALSKQTNKFDCAEAGLVMFTWSVGVAVLLAHTVHSHRTRVYKQQAKTFTPRRRTASKIHLFMESATEALLQAAKAIGHLSRRDRDPVCRASDRHQTKGIKRARCEAQCSETPRRVRKRVIRDRYDQFERPWDMAAVDQGISSSEVEEKEEAAMDPPRVGGRRCRRRTKQRRAQAQAQQPHPPPASPLMTQSRTDVDVEVEVGTETESELDCRSKGGPPHYTRTLPQRQKYRKSGKLRKKGYSSTVRAHQELQKRKLQEGKKMGNTRQKKSKVEFEAETASSGADLGAQTS